MNTYQDTTGVLLFEGMPTEPQAQVVAAWLSEFCEKSAFENLVPEHQPQPCDTTIPLLPSGLPWVSVGLIAEGESDEMTFSVESLASGCEAAAISVGLALPTREGEDDVSWLMGALTRLGEAFGQQGYVERFLASNEEYDCLAIADAVELAMRLSPAGSLRAAKLLTGFHSDRSRLWAHGGYGEFIHIELDGNVKQQLFSPYKQINTAFVRFVEDVAAPQSVQCEQPGDGAPQRERRG